MQQGGEVQSKTVQQWRKGEKTDMFIEGTQLTSVDQLAREKQGKKVLRGECMGVRTNLKE